MLFCISLLSFSLFFFLSFYLYLILSFFLFFKCCFHFFTLSLYTFDYDLASAFLLFILSSLDYNIWHSFCSFSYSRPCSGHIKLSLWRHNLLKKEMKEKTPLLLHVSQDWLILCCCQWMWRHRRKLHMVGIHLTVEKRSKIMPYISVETTFYFLFYSSILLFFYPSISSKSLSFALNPFLCYTGFLILYTFFKIHRQSHIFFICSVKGIPKS